MSEQTAYLSPEDLTEQLVSELKRIVAVRERLVITDGPPQPTVWAQNIWYEAQTIAIDSIGDAAKKLKAMQRNWAGYSFQLHRRAQLIQDALPHVSAKPLQFPTTAPTAPMGSWTLMDSDVMLVAPRCSSPFPNGDVRFEENHVDPPSRAYLKLWDAFVRFGVWPQPGERCLDVGAAPGGWTWVLAELDAEVTAIDRSPLVPDLSSRPNVHTSSRDAFAILPSDTERYDWVFSDIACYPEKLFEWAKKWVESGNATHILCTLKFQGNTHYGAIKDFLALAPDSQMVHLNYNKHELTWFYRQS